MNGTRSCWRGTRVPPHFGLCGAVVAAECVLMLWEGWGEEERAPHPEANRNRSAPLGQRAGMRAVSPSPHSWPGQKVSRL